ncbi:MAG TPA: hypothetical protein VG692_13040 [Gemmatimonadales bacterium]|nr:hypothetical protein [Gemmatimonadales bacterium]
MPETGGGRRPNWLAIAVSLVVHSLLLLVVVRGRPPVNPSRPNQVILVPLPGPEPDRVVPMPQVRERVDRGPAPVPQAAPPAPVHLIDSLPERKPEAVAPARLDTASAPGAPADRIGPGLATGRLWVRPLPVPPKELAKRLQRSHTELVDSAISALAQAYMDSVAREPGADRVVLPDWTTEVNGAKFGLDSRNIYIAGLKIPAAVLALLPIPPGGNQSRALDHSGQWIADDLRRAASRAQTLDEFKQAVRELREQKQWEKDMQRAQRELPADTTTKKVP